MRPRGLRCGRQPPLHSQRVGLQVLDAHVWLELRYRNPHRTDAGLLACAAVLLFRHDLSSAVPSWNLVSFCNRK